MIKNSNLSQYEIDPANPNEGTQDGMNMIRQSLAKLGAGRSIVVDRAGKTIGGAHVLQVARELGLDSVEVETDGRVLVVVKRTDLDYTEDGRARQLAVADNRTNQVNLNFDKEALLGLANEIDLSDFFKEEDFVQLRKELEKESYADNLSVDKKAQPRSRVLPLDMIYTIQGADCTCCLAVQAGLKYGIQSAKYQLCPYEPHLSGKHKVCFVDNDYFNYNHARHLHVVQELKPKYCTVRDVMTEQQCADAKIAFHPLEEILDWAEELNAAAQNVIVIPKYDCLDRIPEKFVLGYSVPTSHGATPLPVSSFKGRRVHLLGGSWQSQLAHMAELGDDVVSADNNHVTLIASQFGCFVDENGASKSLSDIGLSVLNNPRYAALAISFGNIAHKINTLYGEKTNE